MDILKKIFGIFLLIVSAIFSLGTFLNFIREITLLIQRKEEFTSFEVGYTIGVFIGLIIISVLIYFMAKFGLKLVKIKKREIESIDDIGNIQ